MWDAHHFEPQSSCDASSGPDAGGGLAGRCGHQLDDRWLQGRPQGHCVLAQTQSLVSEEPCPGRLALPLREDPAVAAS